MTRRPDPFLRALLAVAACALASASIAAPPVEAAQSLGPYEPGTVLVGYRADAAAGARDRAVAAAGATPLATIGGGTQVLRVPKGTELEQVARLRATPSVRYAEPNYMLTLDEDAAGEEPNDRRFDDLWGLHNTGQEIAGAAGKEGADISAVKAWEVTTGSRERVVGVIDTGVDDEHRDLARNMWEAPSDFSVKIGGKTISCEAGSHGFDAILDSCNPVDRHGHGTHVAGTIGAVGDNRRGVTGVNWQASIMSLSFLDARGSGSTTDAIEAIDFAVAVKEHFGAAADLRVLNASWGGGGFSQALLDAIERAGRAEMLFVAAAGNSSRNTDVFPGYPASYPAANIVSVAATDNRDDLAIFSNYGPASVDLAAPGVGILSTLPSDDYGAFNGTSMAAPHVTGAAALVLAACDLDGASLKEALLDNVDAVASLANRAVTGGRLNVDRAIRACADQSDAVGESPDSSSASAGPLDGG